MRKDKIQYQLIESEELESIKAQIRKLFEIGTDRQAYTLARFERIEHKIRMFWPDYGIHRSEPRNILDQWLADKMKGIEREKAVKKENPTDLTPGEYCLTWNTRSDRSDLQVVHAVSDDGIPYFLGEFDSKSGMYKLRPYRFWKRR